MQESLNGRLSSLHQAVDFLLIHVLFSFESQSLQPSGGLGLRMYAMLLTSLDHLRYRPSPSVIEALVVAGRRLIRVSFVLEGIQLIFNNGIGRSSLPPGGEAGCDPPADQDCNLGMV